MSNLLFLKSKVEDPNADSGDMIIDLDKVRTITTKIIKDKYYVIDFDLGGEQYHVSFDHKEDAISFLEMALIKMGSQSDIAHNISFENVNTYKKEKMDRLKEELGKILR